jgi:hypothetical protein
MPRENERPRGASQLGEQYLARVAQSLPCSDQQAAAVLPAGHGSETATRRRQGGPGQVLCSTIDCWSMTSTTASAMPFRSRIQPFGASLTTSPAARCCHPGWTLANNYELVQVLPDAGWQHTQQSDGPVMHFHVDVADVAHTVRSGDPAVNEISQLRESDQRSKPQLQREWTRESPRA